MSKFKFLTFTAIFLLLSCFVFSSCNAYSSEGIVFEINEDNTAYTVIGYEGNEKNVTVPAEYNGLPVTQLGKHAFGKCESIKKLHLPDTIEKIGIYALYECPNLSYVKFDGTILQWDDIKHANALRQLETMDVECSDGKIPKVTVSSDLKTWDQREKYDVFFWNEGQPLYDNGGKKIIYNIANENIYNRANNTVVKNKNTSTNTDQSVYPESLKISICGKEYLFSQTDTEFEYVNADIDARLDYYNGKISSLRVKSNTIKVADDINENNASDYASDLIKEIFDYDVTANKDLVPEIKSGKYGRDLFGIDYNLKMEGFSLVNYFFTLEINEAGYLEYVDTLRSVLNRWFPDLEKFDGEIVSKKLEDAIARICDIDGYVLQDYEVFRDYISQIPTDEGEGYYLQYTVSPKFLKESTGETAVYTAFTLVVAL